MRIKEHPILDIEDKKTISFSFNGRVLQGQEGEMVSAALFANGIQSFSIHKVEDAPQGIFCANGQCSQCTVIIDGQPRKSCVTPLQEGMEIKTLVHFPELPPGNEYHPSHPPKELECDVLVVGGGPSGITAALELSEQDFSVILVDDKERLGGKLVLQTHKFFGSVADCYAGTRGTEIGRILEEKVLNENNITVLTNSIVAGIYSDQKAGVYENQESYTLVSFRALIVASGARERSLLFAGNDLPGVYGAGAFQTLVNRDHVKSSRRVLIVGCGNVGLIAAYHALQAGIEVAGLVDAASEITGYKVHADKIKRLGVPLYLNHTIISAEGEGKVERATIAQVDKDWNPLLTTAKTFAVDTVLVAVGLNPADEFYETALESDFPVLKTGDANEIAEASSAMIGGKIIGRKMALLLGKEVFLPPEWQEKADILKSLPGETIERKHTLPEGDGHRPILHCYQEIPCNPCATVCPFNSIQLSGKTGTILDLPEFKGKCIGCGLCLLICPGLAITLVRRSQKEGLAEVTLPHEFRHQYKPGDRLELRDRDGLALGTGILKSARFNKKYRTSLLTVEVPEKIAPDVAGILVQKQEAAAPLAKPNYSYLPENAIVCRCERVSVGELLDFIKENQVTDLNQLKQTRAAMGACGGKTCTELLPRILQQAGVPKTEITAASLRPLAVEIPMQAIANQGGQKK
mgnify:CR=1 FL=1